MFRVPGALTGPRRSESERGFHLASLFVLRVAGGCSALRLHSMCALVCGLVKKGHQSTLLDLEWLVKGTCASEAEGIGIELWATHWKWYYIYIYI